MDLASYRLNTNITLHSVFSLVIRSKKEFFFGLNTLIELFDY